MKLSKRDAKIFADALMNPPPPNEALKRAAEQHKLTAGESVIKGLREAIEWASQPPWIGRPINGKRFCWACCEFQLVPHECPAYAEEAAPFGMRIEIDPLMPESQIDIIDRSGRRPLIVNLEVPKGRKHD